MKRVKAAYICQTLHFMLKGGLAHSIAARLVREAHERHAEGVPFLRPSGTPRTQSVRYLLPYSGKAGTGRTGAPQCAA
nr:hypothetical protein [uncultured Agathobaculum sp.]